MMILKLTRGLVLVQSEEKDSTTKAGIVLPDSAKDIPTIGKVISVGKKARLPIPCKTGDRIVYKKWEATKIEYEDKKHLILKFEDILATISS